MEQRHKAAMARVLDGLLGARSFAGRVVFLFGHCNATEAMADYLLAQGVVPAAILDNNEAKRGLSYRGIPIGPLEIVLARVAGNIGAHGSADDCVDSGDSIVLIATRFFAPMSAQLRRLGYGGEIVQVVEYNSFAEYSLSDETLGRQKALVREGVKILERVRAKYPAAHLVVCPHNPLGDVYWALAFLPAYLSQRGIDEVVVAVVGGGCRQVADMFGVANIVTLEPDTMDALTRAIVFTGADNCIIAHHDRPYTDNIIKYLDKHFLSFIDYYRRLVYGLSQDTEPAPPVGAREFDNRSGLRQGQTAIIAPYAKSVTRPPDAFWEGLAAAWRDKGYLVLTNVNAGEEPIKGTMPLALPLDQMVSAAEYAGVFIGLRSGLCDIVHTARCRRIAVFTDCYYSTTPHKIADFFALPGWESVIYGDSPV
ncbi:MAG: hypothetical protein LBK98_03295 [Peptococcaceae bacterium]|jgi:hypothetical protein|nr:hypothetical protein [Peptococcaceae bacterium]